MVDSPKKTLHAPKLNNRCKVFLSLVEFFTGFNPTWRDLWPNIPVRNRQGLYLGSVSVLWPVLFFLVSSTGRWRLAGAAGRTHLQLISTTGSPASDRCRKWWFPCVNFELRWKNSDFLFYFCSEVATASGSFCVLDRVRQRIPERSPSSCCGISFKLHFYPPVERLWLLL